MSCMCLPPMHLHAHHGLTDEGRAHAGQLEQGNHIAEVKEECAHAHVPSIALPDFYFSTPRMLMSVFIMQCVARKQTG